MQIMLEVSYGYCSEHCTTFLLCNRKVCCGGSVSTGSAHIVHVVTTLGQGGAERVCCQIIQRSSSDRHTVIKLFAGHGLFDDEVARASAAIHCLGLPRSPLAFVLLPFAFIRLFWLL